MGVRDEGCGVGASSRIREQGQAADTGEEEAVTEAALVVAFGVGLVLLAAGAWLVAPAVGLIVAGLLLVLVPVWYVRGRAAG